LAIFLTTGKDAVYLPVASLRTDAMPLQSLRARLVSSIGSYCMGARGCWAVLQVNRGLQAMSCYRLNLRACQAPFLGSGGVSDRGCPHCLAGALALAIGGCCGTAGRSGA